MERLKAKVKPLLTQVGNGFALFLIAVVRFRAMREQLGIFERPLPEKWLKPRPLTVSYAPGSIGTCTTHHTFRGRYMCRVSSSSIDCRICAEFAPQRQARKWFSSSSLPSSVDFQDFPGRKMVDLRTHRTCPVQILDAPVES